MQSASQATRLPAKDQAAIRHAICTPLESIPNTEKKLNEVTLELERLISVICTSDEKPEPSNYKHLYNIIETINEYFDYFDERAYRTVLKEIITMQLALFTEHSKNPTAFLSQINNELEQKRAAHDDHCSKVKKRRKTDKISQVSHANLNEQQVLVIDQLFRYFTLMIEIDLLTPGFTAQIHESEEEEEEENVHCIRKLLNHKHKEVPLSIYVERGHLDKLTLLTEIEGNKINLLYSLVCAANSYHIESSISIIRMLLAYFRTELYENDNNCRAIARPIIHHNEIPMLRAKTKMAGTSIPYEMSKLFHGVSLIADYPKLFTLARISQKKKIIETLSHQKKGVQFLISQIEHLILISDFIKSTLLEPGLMRSIFMHDVNNDIVTRVLMIKNIKSDFYRVLSSNTFLQSTFFRTSIPSRIQLILTKPDLLDCFKPAVLLSIEHPDFTTLAHYLIDIHSDSITTYTYLTELYAIIAAAAVDTEDESEPDENERDDEENPTSPHNIDNPHQQATTANGNHAPTASPITTLAPLPLSQNLYALLADPSDNEGEELSDEESIPDDANESDQDIGENISGSGHSEISSDESEDEPNQGLNLSSD